MTITDDLKDALARELDSLTAAREEIRLKAHLAKADAKTRAQAEKKRLAAEEKRMLDRMIGRKTTTYKNIVYNDSSVTKVVVK